MAVGGALAGGAIAGIFSALGQSRANRMNRQEAQLDRDFQARMSGTAVRRRMFDLKEAGLNPILAARHEASSPGGRATAPQQNVGAALAESGSRVAQAGIAAKATKSQIKLQTATAEKINEETQTIRVQREGVITRNIMLKHGEAIASITADLARTLRALVGDKSPEEIAELIKNKIALATSALTNAMESSANTAKATKSKIDQIKSDISILLNDQLAPGRNFDPNKQPEIGSTEKTMQKWRDSKTDLPFRQWLKLQRR